MSVDIEPINAALAGSYEIERELGAGGMAAVFLARDVKHPGWMIPTSMAATLARASKSRSRCNTASEWRCAQAAIKQSTLERTVKPARRAVRKRSAASR